MLEQRGRSWKKLLAIFEGDFVRMPRDVLWKLQWAFIHIIAVRFLQKNKKKSQRELISMQLACNYHTLQHSQHTRLHLNINTVEPAVSDHTKF